MSNIQNFIYNDQNINIREEQGQVWFRAAEVCAVLELVNARQALATHVDQEDINQMDTLTEGGRQAVNFINESGLYALIFGSNKPKAKQFKRWVTSKVLPAIRKTGSYGHGADTINVPADQYFALVNRLAALPMPYESRRGRPVIAAETKTWHQQRAKGMTQQDIAALAGRAITTVRHHLSARGA